MMIHQQNPSGIDETEVSGIVGPAYSWCFGPVDTDLSIYTFPEIHACARKPRHQRREPTS